MKIEFDHNNHNTNIDGVVSQETKSYHRTTLSEAIALDINHDALDTKAYKKHGKTIKDIMQAADSQYDVSTQRNYMTVMSNTMSTKDYNKMMEEGFDPSKMNPEEAITILDHIKAAVAQSGKMIEGYNDDLSDEKLTQITGNPGVARQIKEMMAKRDIKATEQNAQKVKNATNKAQSITSFSDGSMKYMVENDLEPTIGNLYKASYSSCGDGNKQAKGYYAQEMQGYYAKKADTPDFEQLRPQIEKAIGDMDLKDMTKEEAIKDAQWLIEKGIPVTKKALENLQNLRTITFPISFENVVNAAITAISEGKSADEGNLLPGYQSIYEQAVEITTQTEAITDEAVYEVVKEKKSYTLENLFEASKNRKEHIDQNDLSFIEAKRTLEEVRLRMTIDTNLKLLKKGISIDTTELSQLVEQLKQQEEVLKNQFLGNENEDFDTTSQKVSLYQDTRAVLKDIPYLPAAVLGRISMEQKSQTLTILHEMGTELRQQYEKANSSYETLMTAPRRDMGDTIQKAFRNVDDILTDLQFEITESNQKAVRILGYNNMTITKENIDKVKNADQQVVNIIKSMTPGRTLQLIREGKNPLTMSFDELEQALHTQEMHPIEEAEKFSKFLYRLEQDNEITEKERGAYIGVYRLFHQIEKSDGAAVGSIVAQGAELNLGNLLSAVRSSKIKIDKNIDDGFGTLKDTISKGTSISKQIEEGVLEARLSHEIYRNLTPQSLKNITITEQTTVEEIAGAVSQNVETTEPAGYEEAMRQDLKLASQVEDMVFETLNALKQPVNADTIIAAENLLNDGETLFYTIKKYASLLDETNESSEKGLTETISDAANHIIEQFTDKDHAKEAYKEFISTATEVLTEATDNIVNQTIDIKTITLCHKQLALANSLADQETYEVPLLIGNRVTQIHLSIRHSDTDKGMVKTTFDSVKYGKVTASFTITEKKVSAIFTSDEKDGLEQLKKVGSLMEEHLSANENELKLGETHYILGNQQNVVTLSGENADNTSESIHNQTLYRLAKSFLTAFQNVDSIKGE